MTWEDLMAELSALSPSELKMPARVFDSNGGVFIEVLGIEIDEDDDLPFIRAD